MVPSPERLPGSPASMRESMRAVGIPRLSPVTATPLARSAAGSCSGAAAARRTCWPAFRSATNGAANSRSTLSAFALTCRVGPCCTTVMCAACKAARTCASCAGAGPNRRWNSAADSHLWYCGDSGSWMSASSASSATWSRDGRCTSKDTGAARKLAVIASIRASGTVVAALALPKANSEADNTAASSGRQRMRVSMDLSGGTAVSEAEWHRRGMHDRSRPTARPCRHGNRKQVPAASDGRAG
ncbi:hypothetical protein XFF7767_10029 [Xanthomonas citri pv. fuscans]|nr:hypothetical protein XFF7767_10029 [Xanthomonas citri pv. fuscans]